MIKKKKKKIQYMQKQKPNKKEKQSKDCFSTGWHYSRLKSKINSKTLGSYHRIYVVQFKNCIVHFAEQDRQL